jgi:hypothetical protein
VSTDKCKLIHAQSDKRLDEIMGVLQEMNNRLYRDNGHISIQTRLDRHQRIVEVLCWAISVVGGTVLVSVVCFIFRIIRHVGMQ